MILKYKNININYTDTGEGEPVILLHGFLENISMWNDLSSEITQNNRVICIDLLGHGKTESLGYLHTMEDMAIAVDYVLAKLKVNNGYIIGHSMGGYVALALAKLQPRRIKGLCLMNSTFEADDEERKTLRTRANKMIQTNFNAMVRMSFANLFAKESKEIFKTEFEFALSEALKTSLQGYMAAQEGMKLRPDRFEFFKTLKTKKLIILGEKDALINPETIKTKIKDESIDFELFSEGHMSHIENKSELSYFLKRFIE